MDGWYGRQTTAAHTYYVSDGHEVVRRIDELMRELYRVRAALVREIRDDEDERAARVDYMLTAWRAERDQHDDSSGQSNPSNGVA